MVRRRTTKPKGNSAPRPVDRKDSKMKRWETADDIPMDDEDQFHASRDQILLDGAEGDEDDEGDVDEVIALKGMPSDSDSDDEEGEEDVDMDEDAPEPAPKKEKAKKAKGKAVVALDSDEEKAGESEEDESWGAKKSAYYSSNAQELDSDDEEANELEEQEARRLQSKAREALDDDDFGLGDVVEAVEEDVEDPLEEPEPTVTDIPQDKLSLLRHLAKASPETLALANDWEDTAARVVRAQEKLQKLETEQPNAMSLGMVHLHYQTLLTYATNLAFYLHLCASPKYASHPSDLRKHPVFTRLVQLKEALSTLEELDFDISEDEDEEDSELDSEEVDSDELEGLGPDDRKMLRLLRQNNPSEAELDDLEALLRDAEQDISDSDLSALDESPAPPPKKQKKRKDATADEPAKKKRKTSSASAAPVFDLEEPEFVPSSKKRASTSTDAMDVYGDATTLASSDAADKQARRKTLRFHTSKIESAVARRAGARQALGGDDDVPYKERRREGEKRKEREAKERGAVGGADLDDEEPQLAPARKRGDGFDEDGEEGGEGEEDDGYYSLIKKQKKERKEAKKAEHDAALAAARAELMDDADSADGPRGLTRAILKNRGLTPHRSKSVRNPRVKKRQKYDQAKKKLASQRAVYKEGPRDVTRYEGEKSGISKVVKSVKFN
ncbi:hypothetical protein PENSPDRAFT_749962 [Peniophora sp. CONT]|nr:hypothetical protein PENSPDRAFT_749962 [Peniophora sp. CONT]